MPLRPLQMKQRGKHIFDHYVHTAQFRNEFIPSNCHCFWTWWIVIPLPISEAGNKDDSYGWEAI